MEYIILILGLALANRCWGAGYFKGCKEVACVFAGIVTGGAIYLLTHNYILTGIYTVIGGLLFWLYRVWPLSYYFRVFNPGLSSTDTGIPWINDIAKNNWWLCMSLRGLYGIPLIAAFSYFHWWAAPLSLLTFGMGTVYWIQKFQPQSWWVKQWQLPAAEILAGAFIGLISALVLTV